MMTDRYGLPISTASDAARGAFAEGSHLLLTLYPGALAAFDLAIAADPAFALAHAARGRVLQLGGDVTGAQAAVARAEALAVGQTERERSHVGVFAHLVHGRAEAALAAVRTHVGQWPRDAVVASNAANQTGLIGTCGRAGREQEQLDFLAALAPHYGDDWWLDSHYALALSELGHWDEARRRIERSLATEPRNAVAAHSMAHLQYECGEPEASIAFLRDWLIAYPRNGAFRGHLSWHLALVLLNEGRVAEGFALYEDAFAAEDYPGPKIVKLMDAASYLWRAELAGHPRDEVRWRAVHAFAHQVFPRPGVAYADWHVALADAVAGDAAAAEARASELGELAAAGRYPAGPGVAAVARAMAAVARQDHAAAIAELSAVLPDRARFSGSRAQLDLLEFTLLKAYLDAGRIEDARRLVAMRRPGPRGIPVAGAAALH
jgi:tetratricopeptide (TPR) repeat protein